MEETGYGLTIRTLTPGFYVVEMRATDADGRVAIRRQELRIRESEPRIRERAPMAE